MYGLHLMISHSHELFNIIRSWKITWFICDVLHDLVPFMQIKKREKHQRSNVTFSFRVFKLYKLYQTAQRITYSNAKEKEFPESLPVTTLN